MVEPFMTTDQKSIRVLLVDNHLAARNGISAFMAYETDIQIVAEALDFNGALAAARQCGPNVFLIDIGGALRDGVAAIHGIVREFPDARVIVLSDHEQKEYVHRAEGEGASGFVPKERMMQLLPAAIRSVFRGCAFFEEHHC